MIKWIKPLICRYRGHKWETYTVSTGYGSNEIEQAGYCVRCGWDTHGEYEGQHETEESFDYVESWEAEEV
ncbi:hypothetical protein MKX59_19545 [Paenibacillus sp. FSL R7-0340]|jgi:hypothetical protein|uniref:hypothetical protein n=1 Tax=Paenibacillus sp. FSL R7-0340 TaxID=2921684 RepID=UPI0030F6EFCF